MSNQEIKKVQSLIEQCMLHYLNKNEVIDILYQQEKINPSLTRTVWEILEQQNLEFFKGYYLRVILKEQITKFNYLLEKQAALMNQMNIDAVASPVESTGSVMSPGMQSACDFPKNTLAQNPNVGLLQGTDGLAFNSDSGYLGNLLEAHQLGMQSACDFPMNTLAQNPNVGLLQGTDGFAFNSDSGYLGNLLEAHQFAASLDHRFNSLPLASNDQQSTSRTGMQSVFDFTMNTLAQMPNVEMIQGTDGVAFNGDSGYIGNLRFIYEAPGTLLEAHQFATPPDYGFCPLPLVSNDQQATSGTAAQDSWPKFVEQSQRFCKWLMSNGKRNA